LSGVFHIAAHCGNADCVCAQIVTGAEVISWKMLPEVEDRR